MSVMYFVQDLDRQIYQLSVFILLYIPMGIKMITINSKNITC